MLSDWATVRVDDLSFGILDNGEIPIETADWSTGLVAPMSNGAVISTGIHTGTGRVRVALLAAEPSSTADAWEEIVEVSVHSSQGRLRVDAFEEGAVESLPILSTAGPGWYRLRVHARGRTINPDGIQRDPVEDYHLAVWQAPPSPTTILRASDRIRISLQADLPTPDSQAQTFTPEQPAPKPGEPGATS
ncbi:hypothetical protein [Streptomyces sp. NBC_00690]|uniref:hypothetical protein n=1 Tax=Streptomyces sp. NBC_00690 TaxID=2975808 RepID=UPI002E2C4089|nr:hypothetical protein [Streptomyces sp. NBC_00690]